MLRYRWDGHYLGQRRHSRARPSGPAPAADGKQVTVNIKDVTNAQKITITLLGVNDGTNVANVSIPMGVLLGDIDLTKSVSGSDVNRCKSQVGSPLGPTNFRNDVDLTGSVSGSDVNRVKTQVGSSLTP